MCDTIQQVVDFRKQLHQSFPFRSDATMDLIDTLAGNNSAQSAVELSLGSLFPRHFARPLAARPVNHHPNPAPGNKPIIVGHNYSVLAHLPEKQERTSPPWIIPLLIQRVPTDITPTDIGASQVEDLLPHN